MRKNIFRIIAAVMFGVLLFNFTACKKAEKPAVDSSVATEPETHPDTPSEPETVSPVFTDWSKLTPYEPMKEVYTYHPGYCGSGKLQARDDYGVLIPYIGSHDYEDSEFDYPNYGLVTDKGELVTDSVYTDVHFMDDFLVLKRGYRSSDAVNELGYYDSTEVITVASSDGHWVHELSYGDKLYYGHCCCGLLMTLSSNQSLDFWNTYGDVIMRFDETIFKEKLGNDFTWNFEHDEDIYTSIKWFDDKVGYVTYEDHDGDEFHLYLDFQSGEVMDKPPKGYPAEIDYSAIEYDTSDPPDPPKVDGYDDLYSITDDINGETYFYTIIKSYDSVQTEYGIIFDSNGHLLGKIIKRFDFDRATFMVRAGLYRSFEDDCFCLYSLSDNKLVFRYRIQSNTD